jgi:hypothetical protein
LFSTLRTLKVSVAAPLGPTFIKASETPSPVISAVFKIVIGLCSASKLFLSTLLISGTNNSQSIFLTSYLTGVVWVELLSSFLAPSSVLSCCFCDNY